MNRSSRIAAVVIFIASTGRLDAAPEASPYLEPGTLRLSHELSLEGVFHKLKSGGQVFENGLNKTYADSGGATRPWKTEWGQRLLTEVAARVTPDIFGRILFEAQGEYADRYWRPLNIEHYRKQEDQAVFIRQLEAGIDKDNWYARGFSGVGHGDWQAQGDFFALYPAAYPDDDYLGSSGSFGVYPENWKQDFYQNIAHRRVPRGFEAGGQAFGLDAALAYGTELTWGARESVYGRLSIPVYKSRLTFVAKRENLPFLAGGFNFTDNDERREAFALSWRLPWEDGHSVHLGVLYQPFRKGESYQAADAVAAGSGIQGSSYAISTKTTGQSDAYAGRLRLERHQFFANRIWIGILDLIHAGVLAGNKDEVNGQLGTDVTRRVRGHVSYTYRRPVEGPLPFLYEGDQHNIGNIVVNPRGPESPFTVGWDNREMVSLVTTVSYDPTPGSNLFKYNPSELSFWNVHAEENASLAFAVQHRMADYRTTTDRQWYINEFGEFVWEPAGRNGAFPSDGFLHEFRLLAISRLGKWSALLGLSGGQSPAMSGLAYGQGTARNKPLTEYVSLEARMERERLAFWGHYGTGVWGPERNIHPFFGLAFDRLFGLGTTLKITPNTAWDISYIGARQNDTIYLAPDLGAYDEIRTVLSHRFGFLFQFQAASRPGYKAR